MRRFLAPTRSTLLVTGVIAGSLLASDFLSSWALALVVLLDKDAFVRMAQGAAAATNAMHDALGQGTLEARIWLLGDIANWIARGVVSYLAACVVLWLARDRSPIARPM